MANIPRNTQHALFLATKAAEILEVQFRVEDALLLINDATAPPGDHPSVKSAAQHLRLLVPQLATVVGQHALAAKFNIECASEALMVEDELPGISPSQFKAVRTLYRQQEETTNKRPRNDGYTTTQRKQRQVGAAMAALSDSIPAAAPVAPGSSGLQLLPPVAAGSRASQRPNRYPCDACGVVGHWKAEKQCRQADVVAHLKRLTAEAERDMGRAGGSGTQPPPPGTSTNSGRLERFVVYNFFFGYSL